MTRNTSPTQYRVELFDFVEWNEHTLEHRSYVMLAFSSISKIEMLTHFRSYPGAPGQRNRLYRIQLVSYSKTEDGEARKVLASKCVDSLESIETIVAGQRRYERARRRANSLK